MTNPPVALPRRDPPGGGYGLVYHRKVIPLDLAGRSALDLFACVRDEDHAFFLDSAALGCTSVGPTGRFSFFGGRPLLVIRSRGMRIEIRDSAEGTLGETAEPRIEFGNPLHLLRALLRSARVSPRKLNLPFAGGVVGYLAYDLVHFFERLPCTTQADLDLPELYLIVPSFVIIVDQVSGEAHLVAIGRGETEEEAERQTAECAEEMMERFESAPRLVFLTPVLGTGVRKNGADLTSDFTREEYEDAIGRVKGYVAAGDIIQANIAQRLEAPFAGDPFALYCGLRAINPSPFAFYFAFDGLTLASCSPERLLEIRRDRIQTRPIAGTRPRGETGEEDLRLRAELLLSEKERAEHIMLVDLERNDLGRICHYGTVHVDELMTVEQYSHVFHIVSNVSGRLRRGRDAIDAIAACFPGGTITGAPKIRCMEIIDEIERHRRGPYTGSAGYISFDGEMDLNIIIRTFILTGGRAYIHVGGGIVADSEPAREYEETLHKARALLEALERVQGDAQ